MLMRVAILDLFSLLWNFQSFVAIIVCSQSSVDGYLNTFLVTLNSIAVNILVFVIWCSCARVSVGNYLGDGCWIIGCMHEVG